MSVIEPRALTLRDGTVVRLRSPEEADAERMLAYLDAVRRETTGILFAPEDDLPTVEWERQWVRGLREGRGVQILVESPEDELIALFGSGAGDRSRTRHRGDVGISIRAAWCDRGLGTLLMRELIAWAEKAEGLDVLTLCVYADNPRAIRVYEKVGFRRDGVRPWYVKRDGTYVDQVEMTRWVGSGDPPPTGVEP